MQVNGVQYYSDSNVLLNVFFCVKIMEKLNSGLCLVQASKHTYENEFLWQK